MTRIIEEDISVGTGIIKVFQKNEKKLERVFAEFIDNSTQSYIDHSEELKKISKSSICKIIITWNNQEITIVDNCFGMSHEDFQHALKLNNPQSNYSPNSRSQYGMGLKTAASYLGNWYSIESTMYGSTDKYYSEFDLDDLEQNNPTKVKNYVDDVPEEEHFTKITIKKLIKNLTAAVDSSLRKKLALIYASDLSSGDLEIIFNGRPITLIDPELRRNKETGSEYLNYFSDSFIHKEEKYEYSGWIGILKEGSTDDAGLTLSQYGRGIVLNYRPSEIFGKSNSFQYQRVVGEVILNGIKWNISFNKDMFVWDDGLEKEFIKSLSANKDVKEIKKIAGELRKEAKQKPVVKQEDVKKNISSMNDKYAGLSKVKKTRVVDVINDKPKVYIETDNQTSPNIVEIEFESIKYTFDIQIKNDDPDLDWLVIQKKDDNNAYYIIINGTLNYFSTYNTKECKQMIIDFAIALALTQLSSVRVGVGLDKSDILIKQLNSILKNTNQETV